MFQQGTRDINLSSRGFFGRRPISILLGFSLQSLVSRQTLVIKSLEDFGGGLNAIHSLVFLIVSNRNKQLAGCELLANDIAKTLKVDFCRVFTDKGSVPAQQRCADSVTVTAPRR